MVDDLSFCVRLALALVLATAALDKARALDAFAAILARWIGARDRRWARAVVAWEAALAITLCAGPEPRTAGALAALTFAGFSLAAARRVHGGHAGEACGCGGLLGEQRVSRGLVVRNALLAAAAFAVAVLGRGWAWPDVAPALALTLITVGLVLTAALVHEVFALQRPGTSGQGSPS